MILALAFPLGLIVGAAAFAFYAWIDGHDGVVVRW